MTRSEIIEKLKNNKEAFGLMDKELQEAAMQIKGGVWKCLQSTSTLGELKWLDGFHSKSFPNNAHAVHRLRADYQDEPEIIKCEVKYPNTNTGTLYFKYNGNSFGLHKAVNIPEFSHFEYEDGSNYSVPRWLRYENKPALTPKYVVMEKNEAKQNRLLNA